MIVPTLALFDLNVEPQLDEDKDNFGSGTPESSNQRRRKKVLTNAERDLVYKASLESSTNGNLKRNTTILLPRGLESD